MKPFKGKAIYNPSGKAGEYSYWAVNFYNGCSADCGYCYCKKGFMGKLWSITPTIKKSLKDGKTAFEIFKKEVNKNLKQLQEHGLFFNFTSDPFLPETIELNTEAMYYCDSLNIPVKALTKQTWWFGLYILPKNVSIGFTLTGMDELESGAGSNDDRLRIMGILKDRGFNVWVSAEPVINFNSSFLFISKSSCFASHYKIGIESGVSYHRKELNKFIDKIHKLFKYGESTIYWKDDLLKQAGRGRTLLPDFCVDRDYKFWDKK